MGVKVASCNPLRKLLGQKNKKKNKNHWMETTEGLRMLMENNKSQGQQLPAEQSKAWYGNRFRICWLSNLNQVGQLTGLPFSLS